jgi:hypothetical protein
LHEVVKGGTDNAACFVGIILVRCQTAEMITSRVTFRVFESPAVEPYNSRLVLPHRVQFFALIALTKECEGRIAN